MSFSSPAERHDAIMRIRSYRGRRRALPCFTSRRSPTNATQRHARQWRFICRDKRPRHAEERTETTTE
jgi:hypothetical protein